MYESDALSFLEAGQAGRVFLQQQRLNLNWAKAQPLDPSIVRAVEGGATRHLQVAGWSDLTRPDCIGTEGAIRLCSPPLLMFLS